MRTKADNGRKEIVRQGHLSFGRLDELNYYVARVKADKKGEDIYDLQTYHGSPRAAARELALRLAPPYRADLVAFIARWNEGVRRLEKALAALPHERPTVSVPESPCKTQKMGRGATAERPVKALDLSGIPPSRRR